MSKSRPVRWKEGLFLRPHHFQRHELDAEGRVAARLRALAPFGWGVARVEVDPVPLDNFRLEVAALEGVLPDGTVIDLPGAARLPGRSFEALMAEAGRPLDVFVGVRRLEERSPQTAEEDAADGGARYVVRRIEVADLETGGDPQTVEFLDLNLRLIFGGEPADGFDLLPIARLVRTGDRAHPAALDARFAPPALLLSAAPAIHAPARAVVERLATVMRALADVRGGQDPAAALLHRRSAARRPRCANSARTAPAIRARRTSSWRVSPARCSTATSRDARWTTSRRTTTAIRRRSSSGCASSSSSSPSRSSRAATSAPRWTAPATSSAA